MQHKSRWIALISLLALAAFSVMPALGADPWYIFVYSSVTRELVRVNALDGTQTVFDLGLAENVYVTSRDMAFTADGRRAAFCSVQYTPDTSQGDATFYLRDLESAANLLEIDLGKSIACRVSRKGFNEAEGLLAVSLANYFPADPNADRSKPKWQLLVLDATTGGVVNEINADTHEPGPEAIKTEGPILPDVPYFASRGIVFIEVPYGIGGAADFPAYFWQLDQNTVEPIEHWGGFALDSLTDTGELVWADYDPDLPVGEPGGPVPAFNVVMLADKSGEARMIYHSPDWIIVTVRFIANAQQLAVQLLEPFDPNTMEPQNVKWVALGRDGSVTEVGQYLSYAELYAAPGGYTLLWVEPEGEDFARLTMHLDYYDGTQMREVWTQPPNPEFGGVIWEIAGLSPTPSASGLQSFPTYTP